MPRLSELCCQNWIFERRLISNKTLSVLLYHYTFILQIESQTINKSRTPHLLHHLPTLCTTFPLSTPHFRSLSQLPTHFSARNSVSSTHYWSSSTLFYGWGSYPPSHHAQPITRSSLPYPDPLMAPHLILATFHVPQPSASSSSGIDYCPHSAAVLEPVAAVTV